MGESGWGAPVKRSRMEHTPINFIHNHAEDRVSNELGISTFPQKL